MDQTEFFVSERLLLRRRHMHVLEVFDGTSWTPTTVVNLMTDATPLTRDEAVQRLPEGADPSVLDIVDPAVSAA